MADDVELRQKLVLRLQQLSQLEALLDLSLSHAPCSLAIPTSAGTILPFQDKKVSLMPRMR
jgi:hypothetical protein